MITVHVSVECCEIIGHRLELILVLNMTIHQFWIVALLKARIIPKVCWTIKHIGWYISLNTNVILRAAVGRGVLSFTLGAVIGLPCGSFNFFCRDCHWNIFWGCRDIGNSYWIGRCGGIRGSCKWSGPLICCFIFSIDLNNKRWWTSNVDQVAIYQLWVVTLLKLRIIPEIFWAVEHVCWNVGLNTNIELRATVRWWILSCTLGAVVDPFSGSFYLLSCCCWHWGFCSGLWEVSRGIALCCGYYWWGSYICGYWSCRGGHRSWSSSHTWLSYKSNC